MFVVAFILLTGSTVWAAQCPRCGANHGSSPPSAKTVSAGAQASRQKGDRLMQEYHRKAQAARSQQGTSTASSGVSQTLGNLAQARQAQVIKEHASRVLKRKEERNTPNTQTKPPTAAQKMEEETVAAVLNGEEANRAAKRSAARAVVPKLGTALDHLRWVSESSSEAARSGTDDKSGKRSGRGIDSPFATTVYAGDQPVRPAGASLMDLFHKKEKAMHESYLKRANERIKQDKERQGKFNGTAKSPRDR